MENSAFSIRRRIFALAVSLLLVAAVALAAFINDYAERAADRAFDRLLALDVPASAAYRRLPE